ncbi:MAG: ABC transporter permease [Bacteroidota bacterium]
MIKNYFKTTIRNLYRNKVSTLINILGLSLGVTCSLLLLLLVRYEMSFDAFQENYDSIYRIVTTEKNQHSEDFTSGVPATLPDAVRTDFPQIDKVAFTSYIVGGQITIYPDTPNQKKDIQKDYGISYVEPTFLDVFTTPLIVGDKKTVLDEPNEAVISQKWAEELYGKEDPIGQLIKLNRSKDFVISGVMESPKENTDFPFHLLLSYATVSEGKIAEGWGSISSDDHCYVLISDPNEVEKINAGFPAFVEKHFGERNNWNRNHELQALSDLHYDGRFSNYSYSITPSEDIWAMSVVAFFLIATACINFINLVTANAVTRSKEVGIRKVLGSSRKRLIAQFLGETFIITFLAFVISLGLVELGIMYLNPFLEVSLSLNIFGDLNLLFTLIGLIIGISLVSGLYPAFVMSGFKPSTILKSKGGEKLSGKFSLRRLLVVFQFAISQIFIISTIILVSQMEYFKSKDMGFDSDAIVTVGLPDKDPSKKLVLKEQLKRLKGVENVSLNFSSPASGSVWGTGFVFEGEDEVKETHVKYSDRDYLDVYGLELVAGKWLPENDSIREVVVNETFVRRLGLSSPEEMLARKINFFRKDYIVRGVLKDFHTLSLHEEIFPTMFVSKVKQSRMAAVKMNTADLSSTLAEIEDIWRSVYPDYIYSYGFVDEQIAEFYEGEQKMSTTLSLFAFIAIFIGCIGLYGLASFMTNRRVKEIGVRKALGATAGGIVILFSKEYFKLILLAFVIGAPVAGYFMQKWLENFEYHIDLSPIVFIAGILAASIIAFVTVGYRSIRAALANPVNALRDE